MEFNWTHDNIGGAVNAGAQPGIDADDSYTVIRYNLSENDGQRAFGIGGAISNTAIHNNTVYIGKGRNERIVTAGQYTHYPELPHGILFARNVIFNEGSASFILRANQVLIDGNCYLGKSPGGMPKDAHVVKDKTRLHLFGVPIHNRSEASQYRVPKGSACSAPFGNLPNPAKMDFLGTPLNSSNSALRGAIVSELRE